MKRTEVILAADRSYLAEREKDVPISRYFGEDTFSTTTMQEKLPAAVFHRLQDTTLRGKKLDPETANAVAHAMKEWAIEKGATHYCHWFQPMTGSTAEKHDAFIEFTDEGTPIERFSGKQLVQGEPDASSFPSGGIRSTFEARGYTAWDISSPAFILKRGIGTALCIPSVFISYSGEALDKKTPLLRSIEAINTSAINMLRVLGNRKARRVYATLGPEQEYFLIDQDYYYKRQDLLLAGRAVLGAAPPKGQELEDHYFGSIKERIFSFMHDVEEELYKLGIPAKTRHNEVAPSQYELAPLFEEANLAVDHNQILMETLRSVAVKHKLAALLHEKPFAGINGSGKHLNWSLADDQGNNLLNPGKTPQDNIQFLVFLVATIRAVFHHADILRAAVASSGNDHRLGANEAPPAIISVFLGEQLSAILDDIEKGVVSNGTNGAIIDMGISKLPVLSKDNTDRNRTSPFAFTGNKFEFRAVGSSQSISFPATVLNTIVAESLDVLAEKIAAKGENTRQATLDVLKDEIKAVKSVLFMGDNYSKEWEAEAARRGLPNKKTSYESLPDLATPKAVALFEKYRVLSSVELKSRYHVRLERYVKEIDIEAGSLCNMVECQVLPASIRYQRELASAITGTAQALGSDASLAPQKELLSSLVGLIGDTMKLVVELKKNIEHAKSLGSEEEKAAAFGSKVRGTMNAIRAKVDAVELMIDDELWPLPRYWEMLFIK
ncbi:MAG: glutamine synthetase III [Spirochaetes bacterium]|jgi:glutamine synthetase|nr:glutamine synthetase III [Spirochaetota bacterium]